MELFIYPNFLTEKKYDIKYYESPSHFVGKSYVLHSLSIPTLSVPVENRGESLEGYYARVSLNDKLSLILYNIYFLSYDKYFFDKRNILLLPFNVNNTPCQLNNTQYKNLMLSIKAASAVVESKERINREVDLLKKLFKSKTSYDLVIPDYVLSDIFNNYKYADVDLFSGELFDFISKNYNDFMEGLSDFLFDPNIGFEISGPDIFADNCFYNDINYIHKDYLPFNAALEFYKSYFNINTNQDVSYEKITNSSSNKDYNSLKKDIEMAFKTLLKFLDRGVKINSNMNSFECWKKILRLNKNRGNNK